MERADLEAAILAAADECAADRDQIPYYFRHIDTAADRILEERRTMQTTVNTKLPNPTPEELHSVAVCVGKGLRQRLGYNIEPHPEHGFLRLTPDVDDQADDGESPYWLQEVWVNDARDLGRPGAIIATADGKQFRIEAKPLRDGISDPDGILAKAMVAGWEKAGANEERRHIDWLLGEAEDCIRSLGNSVLADRISRHRFQPSAYDPFDKPIPRPEDR